LEYGYDGTYLVAYNGFLFYNLSNSNIIGKARI